MKTYAIVETDAFCGDYPDESFLPIPRSTNEALLQGIADGINSIYGSEHDRWWKVVQMPYTLQPGFEP